MLFFDDSSGTRLYFTFLWNQTGIGGLRESLSPHHFNFGGGATEVANLG